MKNLRKIFAVMGVSMALMTTVSQASASEILGLSQKQQSIITIAAFTANGNLEKLNDALNTGLNSGLTVNEIKEILIQLYAYAGFPRSLNGINTFMTVMDNRKAQGIIDEEGKEAQNPPENWDRDLYGAQVRAKLSGQTSIPEPKGYQVFCPTIDRFLKEHLFADIFVRDNLDAQSRELATIATLSSIQGLSAQLNFHMQAALNTGLTPKQLQGFVEVLSEQIGQDEASVAKDVLDRITKKNDL